MSSRAKPHIINPSEWIPDHEAGDCMKCDAPFSCFVRRHHCRFCGFVLCGDCSSKTVLNVRACDDCHKRYTESEKRTQLLSSTPVLRNVKVLTPSVQGPVAKLTAESPLVKHWRKATKAIHGEEKKGEEAPSKPQKRLLAQGTIVVVDPFSTGCILVNECINRGYDVVAVYSADFPEHIKNLKLPGLKMEFVASVEHKGNLEYTVKQLQDLKMGLKVVLPGCETGVELADAIGEAIGVRNNGTQLTEQRRNKFLMGEQVRKSGTRAVLQSRASQWVEAEIFLKRFGNGPIKVVIKPCSSAGTDGVYLCRSVDEVRQRFKSLIGATNMLGNENKEVVIQEFLEGKEYVVDSVSRDGVHKVITIWEYDKRPANGTNFVYFGMRLVSGDAPHAQQLMNYMKSVLDALGIKNGASHGEVMLTPTGPCLVEVGARCHGGEGSWVPLVTKCLGRNQVTAVIDALTDQKAFNALPDAPILKDCYGLEVMLVSKVEGKLKALPRLDEVRALQSFFQLDMLVKPGGKIVKTMDCITRPGSIRLYHKDKYIVEADFLRIRDMEDNGFFILEEA